jgi:hypothetical protein
MSLSLSSVFTDAAHPGMNKPAGEHHAQHAFGDSRDKGNPSP